MYFNHSNQTRFKFCIINMILWPKTSLWSLLVQFITVICSWRWPSQYNSCGRHDHTRDYGHGIIHAGYFIILLFFDFFFLLMDGWEPLQTILLWTNGERKKKIFKLFGSDGMEKLGSSWSKFWKDQSGCSQLVTSPYLVQFWNSNASVKLTGKISLHSCRQICLSHHWR